MHAYQKNLWAMEGIPYKKSWEFVCLIPPFTLTEILSLELCGVYLKGTPSHQLCLKHLKHQRSGILMSFRKDTITVRFWLLIYVWEKVLWVCFSVCSRLVREGSYNPHLPLNTSKHCWLFPKFKFFFCGTHLNYIYQPLFNWISALTEVYPKKCECK